MSSSTSYESSMDPLYIAAYWSARSEDVEQCALRTERCLAALAAVDPLLTLWFSKRAARSRARVPVVPDAEALRADLLAGRNRRDDDRSVLSDLGFRLGFWNGDDDDPVSLSIKCGLSNGAPGLSNAVVLDLPPPSPRCANLYTLDAVSAQLQSLVDAWSADWAVVTSNSLRAAQGCGGGSPVLGWVSYLSARRGVVPQLPAPFSRLPLWGGSVIMTGSSVPPDAESVLRLRELLGPHLLEAR